MPTNQGSGWHGRLCPLSHFFKVSGGRCEEAPKGQSPYILEFAGYSVAMENANSELKAIAKFKTETNEKAGVVKIIERIIFSQEQIAINKKHFFWNEFNVLAQNYEYLFTDLFNIPLQFKI